MVSPNQPAEHLDVLMNVPRMPIVHLKGLYDSACVNIYRKLLSVNFLHLNVSEDRGLDRSPF